MSVKTKSEYSTAVKLAALGVLFTFLTLMSGSSEGWANGPSSGASDVQTRLEIQIHSFAICSAEDKALVWATRFEDGYGIGDVVYQYDLTSGERNEVLTGGSISHIQPSPAPHVFSIFSIEKGRGYVFRILNESEEVVAEFNEPSMDWADRPRWNSDGTKLFVPYRQFNASEFKVLALGFIDMDTMRLVRVDLSPDEIGTGVRIRDDRIYVTSGNIERAYDYDGSLVGTSTSEESQNGMPSANRKYFLVYDGHEPCVPFDIFPAREEVPIRSFLGCDKDPVPYDSPGSWNPVYDELILLYPWDEGWMHVYDVAQGRVIKNVSDAKYPGRIKWSHDGRSLVHFFEGRFEYIPVVLEGE